MTAQPPVSGSGRWSPRRRFADELGLDVYGVGEHHRPDMVASAPEIVLATIAGATERINS